MLHLDDLRGYEMQQIIASEKNMRLWIYLKLGVDDLTYHVETLGVSNQKPVEFNTLSEAVAFFNNPTP